MRINSSRGKMSEYEKSYTVEFKKLNLTTGVPEGDLVYWNDILCFYLDYKSSVTLTMNGKKYKKHCSTAKDCR